MSDKPLTEDELKQKLASSRITLADTDTRDEYDKEVALLLREVHTITGISCGFSSDETCFSDFGIDASELELIGKRLGLQLDAAYEDDWWLVRVAAKLRKSRQS